MPSDFFLHDPTQNWVEKYNSLSPSFSFAEYLCQVWYDMGLDTIGFDWERVAQRVKYQTEKNK